MQINAAYFPFGLDGVGFVHLALRKLQVKHLLMDSFSFKVRAFFLLRFLDTETIVLVL
jgi:hypothetical protein